MKKSEEVQAKLQAEVEQSAFENDQLKSRLEDMESAIAEQKRVNAEID